MEQNEKVKVVYEDGGIIKVVKGLILKQDEFTISLKCERTDEVVILGKRALVKIQKIEDK